MHYSHFHLRNYKGFLDSGPITLKPGFNIFTGQNDAGKTAILEALALNFHHNPHRSMQSIPRRGSGSQVNSQATCHFFLSRQELQDTLSNYREIFIPGPITTSPVLANTFTALLDQAHALAEISLVNGNLSSYRINDVTAGSSPPTADGAMLQLGPNGQYTYQGRAGYNNHGNQSISSILFNHTKQSIYAFRAERFKVGRFAFGNKTTLASDASNLPQVLNALQANPIRFQRFTECVRRVFPHIQHITLPPISDTEVEVRLWTDDPALERDDLTISLTESGTGVGQVLAMLYILITADFPRIIIIDEPNSFLNPGAVRSLVEIFREHSQHQYIITTHSPEFITAADPSTVHILRRHKPVEQVNAQEARHLRNILSEVGSRLSDVFGADNILWVEGPTEEQCFPLIIRKLLNRPLGRTAIVGVIHTGDFDRADARLVMRLYERLSRGPALLPPAIGFIFDRELRPEKEREDLKRESKKRIAFLARRTYENYLLHPAAIAEVLTEQLASQGKKVTEQSIQAWFDQHKADAKYFGRAKERDFLHDIDAPRLLSDLFFEFSGQTLEYSKMEHSIRLTEWLLEHNPKALEEVANLIAERLNAVPDERPSPS